MNKKLLEILVCPYDKISELELYEFETKSSGNVIKPDPTHSLSSNFSSELNIDGVPTTEANHTNYIDSTKKNESGSEETSLSNLVVVEGLLLCKNCQRFYPIVEEIPIILPDELRDKNRDLEILNRRQNFIPQNILKNLKPWTISNN